MSSAATYTVTLQEPSQGQLILRASEVCDLAYPVRQAEKTPQSISDKSLRRPLFTWTQLQDIVASGSLHKLSRHPDDLREYFAWMEGIRQKHGSVHAYILAEKLTASKLTGSSTPPLTAKNEVQHFQSSFLPGADCQILINDWPYSIPHEVTHHVVWSYLPILHRDLVNSHQIIDSRTRDQAWSVISRRGLCGTLSSNGFLKVPSLADHLTHLPYINIGPSCRSKVEKAYRSACSHIVSFIRKHWDLNTHEAVFFANPPSLQSVPSLAHFHVLVKPVLDQ